VEAVHLDGSQGEGGGQILRSALALSLLTRRPFSIEKIRAGRQKPGLLRQHLTCVTSAATIGSADLEGAELGSKSLRFVPNGVFHSMRTFSIGTAGSSVLVLQTLIPPLLVTPGKSRLVIEGGTYNPLAPPWPFLERAFLPLLRRMGAKIEGKLEQHGFVPAGGGRVVLEIEGVEKLEPLSLLQRGRVVARRATAMVSNLPYDIAEREVAALCRALDLRPFEARAITVPSSGPGNAVELELELEHNTELISAIGSKGVSADQVAAGLASEAKAFLDADVPVGEHLADQLLLPLAIAGGGEMRTVAPTLHTRTNAEVIARFLPIAIDFTDEGRGAWRVTVRRAR
jgi:RNA 3'-terminal phosphate cyclase (ATP)